MHRACTVHALCKGNHLLEKEFSLLKFCCVRRRMETMVACRLQTKGSPWSLFYEIRIGRFDILASSLNFHCCLIYKANLILYELFEVHLVPIPIVGEIEIGIYFRFLNGHIVFQSGI